LAVGDDVVNVATWAGAVPAVPPSAPSPVADIGVGYGVDNLDHEFFGYRRSI
jgi:hypothetical protein